jgi:hypothetical protein
LPPSDEMHVAGSTPRMPLAAFRWIATALRWIATVGATFCITIIAEENIRYFAEKQQWNELLTKAIELLPDLSALTERNYTWFGFGLFTGIAVALWVTRFFVGSSEAGPSSTTIEKSRVERDFPTSEWDIPLTPVFRQDYKNETVPLDGKDFIQCTFENVTFLYQGTRPIQMTNCKKVPATGFVVTVQTDNPVVFTALSIMHATGVASPIELDLRRKDIPR